MSGRDARPTQAYAFKGELPAKVVSGLGCCTGVEYVTPLEENGMIVVKAKAASWDDIEDEIVRLILEHHPPVPGRSLMIATRGSARYRVISFESPVQAQPSVQ